MEAKVLTTQEHPIDPKQMARALRVLANGVEAETLSFRSMKRIAVEELPDSATSLTPVRRATMDIERPKMRPQDLALVCRTLGGIYPKAIVSVQRAGWIDFMPEFGGLGLPLASIEVSTGKLVTVSASEVQENADVTFTGQYPAGAQMADRGDL